MNKCSDDPVGLDDLSVYVPKLCLSATGEFASSRSIDPDKLTKGIGIKRMAIPDAHEDAATMVAMSIKDLMVRNCLNPDRLCRVLKVFRTPIRYGPVTRVMKLDQRKTHWIIHQKQKGVPTKQIALGMKISRRRVQQIWKSFKEQGQEPQIGQNMGRPRKPFDYQEAQVIAEAFGLYRFGARMLEVIIRKVFEKRISHNCIHMYLKVANLAHEDPQKKKRRKWVRYKREHSMSAGHIDWHESGWSDLKVCVIIDDASRMILAGGEFKNANTKNSKLVVDQLVKRYWWLCPMRELIMDHGAEFGAHRVHEDG